MAVSAGTFTVTIDSRATGGDSSLTSARLQVRYAAGRQWIKDSTNDQLVVPHASTNKPIDITLPYSLVLDTDVMTGESEDVGYTVTLITDGAGKVEQTFPAQAADSTTALTDLTSEFNAPVPENIALRAEAAQAAAEAAQAAAEAVPTTTDGLIAAQIADPESSTSTALSATIGAVVDGVPFSEITAAPTLVEGYLPIGVVGGELYARVEATNAIVRLVSGAWTAVVTLPAGTAPTRLHELDNGEVIVNRDTELWLSSGWATNPATATFTKVLEVPNPAETRFPPGYGGVSVSGDLVFATEYGTHGTSRYAWLSTDSGETFTEVFDLHDFPGGTTSGLGGAHMHGVCINPNDDTLFAMAGDAAATGIWYAEVGAPTVWTAIPNHPGDAAGRKVQATSSQATEWGLLLGSDGDPNGLWMIPNSATRDYTLSFVLTRYYGAPDAQVVAQHTYLDAEGVMWTVFSGIAASNPSFITAGTGPSNQGVVWEDTSESLSAIPQLVFAHGDKIYVSLSSNDYLTLPRPSRGEPKPLAADSGWVLGGTAPTDQRAVAVGIGSEASGIRSTAIGTLAEASGAGAVAIGREAVASAQTALAIGGGNGVAGSPASATADNAVAIGSYSSCTAVGVAIGSLAKATATNTVAVGPEAEASQSGNVAVGYQAKATTGSASTALGRNSTAGSAGTSIGYLTTTGTSSVAVGHSSSASGSRSVTVGREATSASADSVALGYQTAASATFQVAVGARHFELGEVASAPAAPAANKARLYVADNGSGKTALYVRFPTGAVQQVAIEP